MDRRRFLSLSAVTVGLAGCSSATDSSTATSSPVTSTSTSTAPSRTTADGTYLRAFQQDLGQLALDIRTLEAAHPLVSLDYATATRQYQAMADQIGRISGLFFKQLRNGWTATRLNATASLDDGAAFTWHARADWYERYAAEEITADQLTLKVLDTVQRRDS